MNFEQIPVPPAEAGGNRVTNTALKWTFPVGTARASWAT